MTPRISELEIRNIRCFNSTQRARLNRITLLVGENGVGKSTFLGCYNAFANLSNLVDLTTDNNPFNLSPFLMGDFDTIARLKKSRFSISGKYENHIHSNAHFSFERGRRGQPFEHFVSFAFSRKGAKASCINIALDKLNASDEFQLSFHGPNFSFDLDWADISFLPIFTWLSLYARKGFLPYSADRATFKKRRQSQVTSEDIVAFGKFINFFRSDMPMPSHPCFDVIAMEPRGIPRQRTYKEPPFEINDDQERALVNDVGTNLGLWNGIELRKNTVRSETEIYVETAAGSHNLMDVGYGVTSLLSVIRAIAAADAPCTFLLQHPEVHVHPVAQANLAQYMAEGPHNFIIETHSDHLVDRFRLCVKDHVLQPDELLILYFENRDDGVETRIHNISVDSMGNVLDPPDTYRKFFLTETKRLLGIK